MKRYIFLLLAAAAFTACKKETVEEQNDPTPAPASTANNYMKLDSGNYWVYKTYSIDTDGVETFVPLNTDSSYVSGDTVINGKTYYELFDFLSTKYLRDSSGFIVDTAGVICFTNVVFNVSLFNMNYGIGYMDKMTVSTPVAITVPAGTFTAYDWLTTMHFTDPGYQWDPVRYAHDYYTEGVGKVKQVYFFSNGSQYYERRLVHYHVQ